MPNNSHLKRKVLLFVIVAACATVPFFLNRRDMRAPAVISKRSAEPVRTVLSVKSKSVQSPHQFRIEQSDLSQLPQLEEKAPGAQEDPAPINSSTTSYFRTFGVLLNDPVHIIRLCDIPCSELSEFLRRYHEFSGCRFDPSHPPESDSAFELAKLVNQVSFGRSGAALIDFMTEIQLDPISIRAQWNALRLISHLGDLLSAFEGRGKQSAIEAEELVQALRQNADVCSNPPVPNKDWSVQCRSLEEKINFWIDERVFE